MNSHRYAYESPTLTAIGSLGEVTLGGTDWGFEIDYYCYWGQCPDGG
ncbi:lasso RiPP family leader peptide-containing protein [Actinomadura sp. CNU-125]|nr:lasso RiPP family leader peptide-containing protein [Actinomadura sp. CNU-125]